MHIKLGHLRMRKSCLHLLQPAVTSPKPGWPRSEPHGYITHAAAVSCWLQQCHGLNQDPSAAALASAPVQHTKTCS